MVVTIGSIRYNVRLRNNGQHVVTVKKYSTMFESYYRQHVRRNSGLWKRAVAKATSKADDQIG